MGEASGSEGWSGQGSCRSLPSSLTVSGFSLSSARPASTNALRLTPAIWRPKGLPDSKPRSSTGWKRGRRPMASRAVTRWIVQRCSDMRTAFLVSTRRESSSGRNPSRRDHRPTYGSSGTWACMATRRSIVEDAEALTRRRRSWRASRARFSARLVRTWVSRATGPFSGLGGSDSLVGQLGGLLAHVFALLPYLADLLAELLAALVTALRIEQVGRHGGESHPHEQSRESVSQHVIYRTPRSKGSLKVHLCHDAPRAPPVHRDERDLGYFLPVHPDRGERAAARGVGVQPLCHQRRDPAPDRARAGRAAGSP